MNNYLQNKLAENVTSQSWSIYRNSQNIFWTLLYSFSYFLEENYNIVDRDVAAHDGHDVVVL